MKTASKLIHTKETGADAQRARAVGLTLKAGPVPTIGAVHGQVWHEVDKVLHVDPTRDERHRVGWSTPSFRAWLMQTTIIASWKASARTALQCARAVCLQRKRPLPDVASSAWAIPTEFLIDLATELDLEAIDRHQDSTSLGSVTEHGERRHVHDDSTEAMSDADAATHAAMHDHLFLVTDAQDLQEISA